MIPLWTTTSEPSQSVCGWAFSSEGRPCVAQRVWPMPSEPASGLLPQDASSILSLPAARRTWSVPSLSTAMPAES